MNINWYTRTLREWAGAHLGLTIEVFLESGTHLSLALVQEQMHLAYTEKGDLLEVF